MRLFSLKKNSKKILLPLLLTVFLAGCRVNNTPITSEATGFWDKYIIYNLSQLITWFAKHLGNNFGLGIIVVTLIIRLILLPLYQYQLKSSEKMQAIQPEMQALREKYSSKDPETQAKLEEELQALNKKHDYNPLSGCLPMLVQLPLLMAFYEAIRRTEAIRNAHFLWLTLGKPDPYFILPILAAVFTWYNTRLMTMANQEKNSQMAMMQWLMPILILFMGANLPSALALYWVVGNSFMILQTLLLNNPYQKRAEREAKEKKRRYLERQLEKARRNPRKFR